VYSSVGRKSIRVLDGAGNGKEEFKKVEMYW
jgi:hypothetical protein